MNDSDRILAAGVPIIFIDGSTANIRFGLFSVKLLEDHYGSIFEFQEHLNACFESAGGQPKGKAYGMMWELLQLGLRRLELSDDELEDKLDPARLSEYMDAITEALQQGLGGVESGGGSGPKAKAKGRSPGRPSTTSQRPLAAVATPSSGK